MESSATPPNSAAKSVKTRVKAPTSDNTTLATARPLVRTGCRRRDGTAIGWWQSGQLISWPANVSSTSKRAPQAHDSASDMEWSQDAMFLDRPADGGCAALQS